MDDFVTNKHPVANCGHLERKMMKRVLKGQSLLTAPPQHFVAVHLHFAGPS